MVPVSPVNSEVAPKQSPLRQVLTDKSALKWPNFRRTLFLVKLTTIRESSPIICRPLRPVRH